MFETGTVHQTLDDLLVFSKARTFYILQKTVKKGLALTSHEKLWISSSEIERVRLAQRPHTQLLAPTYPPTFLALLLAPDFHKKRIAELFQAQQQGRLVKFLAPITEDQLKWNLVLRSASETPAPTKVLSSGATLRPRKFWMDAVAWAKLSQRQRDQFKRYGSKPKKRAPSKLRAPRRQLTRQRNALNPREFLSGSLGGFESAAVLLHLQERILARRIRRYPRLYTKHWKLRPRRVARFFPKLCALLGAPLRAGHFINKQPLLVRPRKIIYAAPHLRFYLFKIYLSQRGHKQLRDEMFGAIKARRPVRRVEGAPSQSLRYAARKKYKTITLFRSKQLPAQRRARLCKQGLLKVAAGFSAPATKARPAATKWVEPKVWSSMTSAQKRAARSGLKGPTPPQHIRKKSKVVVKKANTNLLQTYAPGFALRFFAHPPLSSPYARKPIGGAPAVSATLTAVLRRYLGTSGPLLLNFTPLGYSEGRARLRPRPSAKVVFFQHAVRCAHDLLRYRYKYYGSAKNRRLSIFRSFFKRQFSKYRHIGKNALFVNLFRSHFSKLTGHHEAKLMRFWFQFRRKYTKFWSGSNSSLVQRFSQAILLTPEHLTMFLGLAPNLSAAKAVVASGAMTINGSSSAGLGAFMRPGDSLQLVPALWARSRSLRFYQQWSFLKLKIRATSFFQADWSLLLFTMVCWPRTYELVSPSYLSERWIRYYIRHFPIRARKRLKIKARWGVRLTAATRSRLRRIRR